MPFKWRIPKCFSIYPAEGTLIENGVCQTEIKFSPEAAGVYEGQAILVFGDSKWKQIKLEGIGKYPYVSLKPGTTPQIDDATQFSDFMLPDKTLDFGETDFGQIVTKSIEFENTTNINAAFTVSHLSSGRDIDRFFFCPSTSGQILAQNKVNIKFTYQPFVCEHQNIEYFAITPVGQLSRTIVKCMGRGKGPAVKLNCNQLDFGIIEKVGTSKTLSLVVSNESSMPAHFQVTIIDGGYMVI